MKVLYDISILGQGYINPKARTGIFRMAESLILHLLESNNSDQLNQLNNNLDGDLNSDLEIKLAALNQDSTILDQISSHLYLQELQPEFVSNLIDIYRSPLKLDFLYHNVIKIESLLIQRFPNNNLAYKLSRIFDRLTIKLANIETKISSFDQLNQFDIYHSPYFPFADYRFPKAQRVLTVHDLIPILFKEWVTKRVYQRFLRTISNIDLNRDWVTCDSEQTKRDFCNYTKMSPERVFVTPLAASSIFRPIRNNTIIQDVLERYQINNAPYFLSLCTLEPRKNLDLLVRCFAKIVAENPTWDVNLVLVGVSGWKNQTIFTEAESNPHLKSRIIFAGYVPDEDLSAIYSGALAFVYPSLYEGFGLPPLEAMQCGTPVITSNTSSIPEVVGDSGIMIDPKVEDELCQALFQVFRDQTLRDNLSAKGLERASHFSWSKCAATMAAVYRTAHGSS